jgi:ArsR family transcriptional regulator
MARERWPFIADDARLLKALADETRLGIVLQLREQGDVCQCDFVACCTVAQPTVSHHLRVLREAGVIEAEKRGVWMHYRLSPDTLGRLSRYLP